MRPSILYLVAAFLLLIGFSDWPEQYILWFTWRGIQFNILNEILFYLISFFIYLLARYFIQIYKLILVIDFFYISLLLYYIFYFFEEFQHLNINLLNVSVTGILYVYLIIFLYFFIDFLYCLYKVWWQAKNWIKNWGWKLKLKNKK